MLSNKKLFVKDVGTFHFLSNASSFKESKYHKGKYRLEIQSYYTDQDIHDMLKEISFHHNLDFTKLKNSYLRWCHIIQQQIAQINKADFIEIGYLTRKNDVYTFDFYNDKYVDLNAYYPSVSYVKRQNNKQKEDETTLEVHNIKDNTFHQKWLPLLASLLLYISIVSISIFINKKFINTTENVEVKNPPKQQIKQKDLTEYTKSQELTKVIQKRDSLRKKKKSNKQTSITKKDKKCMIVTGSFKKVKNLERMEKKLLEKYPNQVVKNINGEFTRIGLKISCKDDTSLQHVQSYITNDAWLLNPNQ